MKRRLCAILASVMVFFGVIVVTAPARVSALTATECVNNSTFLGLRPWYAGMLTVKGGKCVLETWTESNASKFVWTIVLNILSDLFIIVGYATVLMGLYGGFVLIMSKGLPNEVVKGKKILITAAMGAGLALLATTIVRTIVDVLTGVLG